MWALLVRTAPASRHCYGSSPLSLTRNLAPSPRIPAQPPSGSCASNSTISPMKLSERSSVVRRVSVPCWQSSKPRWSTLPRARQARTSATTRHYLDISLPTLHRSPLALGRPWARSGFRASNSPIKSPTSQEASAPRSTWRPCCSQASTCSYSTNQPMISTRRVSTYWSPCCSVRSGPSRW